MKNNLVIQEENQSFQKYYDEQMLKVTPKKIYNIFIKRILDICVSFVAIVVFSPFYLIIGIAIAIETGFPVLYCPLRGGYKHKNFHIFKFRTMVKNADKIGGGTTALNDKRITKVGAVLRKTKLDELPQLFNVLIGTMSLIGPRPELLKYTDNYDSIEKNILNVRPGITDFSSLSFISLDEIVGSENADEMYEKLVLKEKNQLRLKYVAEVSFLTDLKLLFKTIFKVIRKITRHILKR